MRSIIWFLGLWIGVAPALADSAFVAPTANGTAAVGQLPGTTTNDDAAAGKVGEIAAVVVSAGTATVIFTNGSANITWTSHPYPINTSGIVSAGAINFTTTGGLPTNFVVGTTYYAVPTDANTLRVGTTVANALAGTFVSAGSAGSGTQTGVASRILASTTPADWGGIALTAGDWDCGGSWGVIPASTVTALNAWVGTASVTAAANSSYFNLSAAFTSAQTISVPLAPTRMLVASTTNTFFSGTAAFASTAVGFGNFRCRRIR